MPWMTGRRACSVIIRSVSQRPGRPDTIRFLQGRAAPEMIQRYRDGPRQSDELLVSRPVRLRVVCRLPVRRDEDDFSRSWPRVPSGMTAATSPAAGCTTTLGPAPAVRRQARLPRKLPTPQDSCSRQQLRQFVRSRIDPMYGTSRSIITGQASATQSGPGDAAGLGLGLGRPPCSSPWPKL